MSQSVDTSSQIRHNAIFPGRLIRSLFHPCIFLIELEEWLSGTTLLTLGQAVAENTDDDVSERHGILKVWYMALLIRKN